MELPDSATIKALLQRYGTLASRLQAELAQPPLVLPNSDFFPDTFMGDEASVQRLVERMQEHGGIDDIPVSVAVVGAGGDAGKSCSTGSCSPAVVTDTQTVRVEDLGNGWRFNIPAAELQHPTVLTCNAARSLGAAFLYETKPEDAPLEEPLLVSAELAAVALGYGALLLEGAHVYQKSCGGPSIQRFTTVNLPELAIVVALFIQAGDHRPRLALKTLATTQRAVLEEALAWARSNPKLVAAFRDHPKRLARGDFKVAETRSWLDRWLSRGKSSVEEPLVDPDASLEELEASLGAFETPRAERNHQRKDPKKDALKELVDEAFR